MLDSLNFLKDRIEDDDINTNNISIDSPAANDNSASSNNDSSARQMNYTLDEDSAPPSVSCTDHQFLWKSKHLRRGMNQQ